MARANALRTRTSSNGGAVVLIITKPSSPLLSSMRLRSGSLRRRAIADGSLVCMHVEVAGEELVGPPCRVGLHDELDAVEVDRTVPPVVVAHELGAGVLGPALELERTGADRALVEVRVGLGRAATTSATR